MCIVYTAPESSWQKPCLTSIHHVIQLQAYNGMTQLHWYPTLAQRQRELVWADRS